jgi:hypothetical protein
MADEQADYKRILREIRYERQMQKKRLYEQAKRQQKTKTKTA